MSDNDRQSSQGQTLQRAQESGRDPSSSWGRPGFTPPTEAQSYVWDGNLAEVPDWIDQGWASYDAGPALAVPQGDPSKAPYTTQPARIGDTVTYTPGKGGSFGGFKVVRAEETGSQPGPEFRATGPGETPSFRPAAQTEADLNDLVRSGMTNPDEMDPDARAQWEARRNQGSALTAEQAGHIPSEPQQGQQGSQPRQGQQKKGSQPSQGSQPQQQEANERSNQQRPENAQRP
jgi:type II secretory pathway pseudopilin PulG